MRRSRGLGDVYKIQAVEKVHPAGRKKILEP
jgi:hypothetical protein